MGAERWTTQRIHTVPGETKWYAMFCIGRLVFGIDCQYLATREGTRCILNYLSGIRNVIPR